MIQRPWIDTSVSLLGNSLISLFVAPADVHFSIVQYIIDQRHVSSEVDLILLRQLIGQTRALGADEGDNVVEVRHDEGAALDEGHFTRG